MNMLGSILSAGVARPGGMPATPGEGADGAPTGLGEMFAAAIAAASAPVGAAAGAEKGATVSVPTAATPATPVAIGSAGPAVGPKGAETDAVSVSELTLVVLGNGGVARGEAQSLPTPEPLPEKRVLAQAPEGEAPVVPVGKTGKASGRIPGAVLTPTGFDQPALTKAVAPGADQPLIAAVVEPAASAAVPQAGDGRDAVTPAPARRGRRKPAVGVGAAKTGPTDPAATAPSMPFAAPLQQQQQQQQAVSAPPPALTVPRRTVEAYRAGAPAQTPAQAPDASSGLRTVLPDAIRAETAPPTIASPAETMARVVAEVFAPTGKPVATKGRAETLTPVASPEGEVAPLPAPVTAPATPIAFATPSPLRATRHAEVAAHQSQVAASAPAMRSDTDAIAVRPDRAEVSAPAAKPAALAADPVTPSDTIAPAVVTTNAIDGAPRVIASAPATPQIGNILSDQVIDMGIDGQWIDRLAREITQVADGTGHSRFQLSPPHLGRIQVDLWQGEAGGRVHLLTETDEAAARLREGQSTLQADARLAALSLGQVVIERAAAGNLDAQPDPNTQSNPQQQQPQSRGQDGGQTSTPQNGQSQGQSQGQPQAQQQGWSQNGSGSGPSQGQSGNSGGQHGKSGDPRAVLEEQGRDAGTTRGGESRIRYA